MKIALLSSGFPPARLGGAETAKRPPWRLCWPARHRVTVFTRSDLKPYVSKQQPDYAVYRRLFVDIPLLRFPLDVISTVFFLAIRRRHIDVILAYQTIIDGLIAVVSLRRS